MRWSVGFLAFLFFLVPSISIAEEDNPQATLVRQRIHTHARMLDFSLPERAELSRIVENVSHPVVLRLMEMKLLEGAFKRKNHSVILKTLKRMAESADWAVQALSRCFRSTSRSHQQIALTFVMGGLHAGMSREMFEVFCSHFGRARRLEVLSVVDLVKTATVFSSRGIEPSRALQMVRSMSPENLSHFHFTLMSELTVLGVRSGLSPEDAFSEARRFFRRVPVPRKTSPLEKAGYRR